jgi:hypothetical protein
VSVTTLAASYRTSQVGALCHSIAAFLAHCRDTRDAYDALILTRFDLYLKTVCRHSPPPDAACAGVGVRP